MDLWQMKVFTKVVECKSFSKGGKEVYLSQPTVSSHIKDLEEHVGCTLLDRMGKEVVPTEAGLILYEYSIKLLKLRDETEEVLSKFLGKIHGKINCGGSTIPGGYILPKIISEFVKKYKDVTINLGIKDTTEIIEEIESGKLEYGVVGAKATNKNITQHKLISDKLCLVVANDHKWNDKKSISVEQIFEEPFISREQGSGTLKSISLSLIKAGYDIKKLKVIAEMGNTVSVCQAVKNNAGISILSPIAVADELKYGTLKALDITGIDLSRNFYLTKHKYKTLSPTGELFLNFIKDQTKELFSDIGKQEEK
ncbi:MAG: LysR family transcriptional regulator [Desulfobacterales bacterium]|nr:LysR family transcriptional regulator [Desulfobacterales bacterium]MCP4160930.1 LysR family transcriptional regulator [Deltaproteobacteria bacterium]